MANLAPQRHQTLRQGLYWVLGLGVTIALLSWSVRDLSPAALGQILQQVNPWWLGVALVAYLLSFTARAWRWGIMLAAECPPGPFLSRCQAVFVGYATNSILPASAGEVVRAALLNRWAQVPFQPALGSVLGERLMDILTVFLILGAVLSRQPQIAERLPLGLIGFIIGGSCGLFWLGARFPKPIARGLARPLHWLGQSHRSPAIEHLIAGILGGLKAFRQPQRFTIALLATFLAWGLNGITYWAVLYSLNLTAPGWLGALATQSLAAFAIALPSSPGYIGPFEAALRFSLGLYGVSGSQAIATALLLRFVMYLITPLLGLGVAAKLGLSRQDLATK